VTAVESVRARAFTVPTDRPESDGTLAWDATTMVVATVRAGPETGLGYGYGPPAIARLVTDQLADVALGTDPMHPRRTWGAMRDALRHAGQAGAGAMALSIVDIALHDLRARLLGVALTTALGAVRDRVEAYGSGGFCTYGPGEVAEQLGGWAADGFRRVKMKVGRDPVADADRLRAARDAIGDGVRLMVDANGAFTPSRAIGLLGGYAAHGVDWLEEPVSSDDLDGLRRVRDHATPRMAVAAGEYCWSPLDARRMLEAQAVDVLQADVTRCGGITGLLRIDALAGAHGTPMSVHCAPAISAHVGCAMTTFVHLEAFHDHLRVESMLLDGLPDLRAGHIAPDSARPGHGLSLREADALPWEV
jgi:L-alanine-DL-glutamate epimerase-like enolase superfamily enzyme